MVEASHKPHAPESIGGGLSEVVDFYAGLYQQEHGWKQQAGCNGMDTDLFFEDLDAARQESLAKVCGGCAVKDQCLEFALENKEFGYWGGTTEDERKKIRKQGKQRIRAKKLARNLTEVQAQADNSEIAA